MANDVYESDEEFIGLGETSCEIVDNSECKSLNLTFNDSVFP